MCLILFLSFLDKNVPKNAISNAQNFLKIQNFYFCSLCIMAKKGPDLLYIYYVGVVVLFLLSVLRQTEVVQNVALLFLKVTKGNHIIFVIFRKHFSHSLINMYGLKHSSLGILIYSTFQLSSSGKKCPKFIFLSYFCNF